MAEQAKSTEPSAGQPAEPVTPTSTDPLKPTIHEAELESGPSGRVLRAAEIDFDTAVARRRAGRNIVVCGDETAANRRLAGQIEAVVGLCVRADPHVGHAGKFALPHYQQTRRAPPGPA